MIHYTRNRGAPLTKRPISFAGIARHQTACIAVAVARVRNGSLPPLILNALTSRGVNVDGLAPGVNENGTDCEGPSGAAGATAAGALDAPVEKAG